MKARPASDAELAAFCRDEYPRLVRSLAVACGDAHLAEELAQEALERTVARWGRVRGLERPGGWAYRVGLNLARTAGRRQGAERRARARLPVDRPASSEPEVADRLALREALLALPHPQREVLVLRFVADFTVAEAAATLGISRSAVTSRTQRGVTRLRELLDLHPRITEEASDG